MYKILFLAGLCSLAGLSSAFASSISGKVTGVGDCSWYRPTVSEHDPMWKCANVDLGGEQKPLEVVFSGSNDIMWFQSPKLVEGATGRFVLDANSLPGHLLLVSFSK